jgi:DNA polymerase III delta prime subunit
MKTLHNHQVIEKNMINRNTLEQCATFPCSFLICGPKGVGKKQWVYALAEKEKTKSPIPMQNNVTFGYSSPKNMIDKPIKNQAINRTRNTLLKYFNM